MGAPRGSPPLTQRLEVMYGVSTSEDNRDKELQLIVGGILREVSFIDFCFNLWPYITQPVCTVVGVIMCPVCQWGHFGLKQNQDGL